MPDIPEQPAVWSDIPLIETTDRVLGGVNGAANRQAVHILQRVQVVKALGDTATAAVSVLTPLVAQARSGATAAATAASTAQAHADAADANADAAAAAAAAARAAAATADAKATTAQTMASNAGTAATAATTLADTKATRFDLGAVTITYSAVLALGAGARSVPVSCPGARVGDAIFVAATGAIPDGYAVGAAQCLAADVLRVSVVHPALVLGASFSIPLRVFALR